MTVWFVSRHPGAVQWAQQQALAVDCFIAHLNPDEVSAGDTVIGTLPINVAAIICAAGARYLHLAVELPPTLRGLELTADDLHRLGARLQRYRIEAES